MELGVSTLPKLSRDTTDRNRTSPFAFTGNKFEFRAVGSTQPCYWPNTVLNTIVAEAVENLVDELESGKGELNKNLAEALRKRIKAHKRVLFSGNGYSKDWHKEAARRGLPNLKDTPACLKAAHNQKYAALFEKHKVTSRLEYESRVEIGWERYVKVLNIEANSTLDIARNQILPAALAHQGKVAAAIRDTKLAGVAPPREEITILQRVSKDVAALSNSLDALEKVLLKANAAESKKQGEAFRDLVLPAMNSVRTLVDSLEDVVEDDLWPLPKYREMLFQY
jgi:glutamine synthetase